MIECYFDDSGTHTDSRMVVWGGVVGSAENFEHLDNTWKSLLSEPLPGKASLKQFHLSQCVNGWGEFSEYSKAEKDRTRLLFRKAIICSGVMPLSVGVDVVEWDSQVSGSLRESMGGAERCAFGLCARAALRIAAEREMCVSVHFDKGRSSVGLDLMLRGARELIPHGDNFASFAFSSVADFTGLQAADTVAYESYRYGLKWLDDPSAKPGPHLKHFVEHIEAETHFGMIGIKQISNLVSKMTSKS